MANVICFCSRIDGRAELYLWRVRVDSQVCVNNLQSEYMFACQEAHRKTMIPLLEEFVSKGWVRVESHPVAFLEVRA